MADASQENRVNCDWVGNNAAFTCPVCGRVFVVSGMLHRDGRLCPCCHKATGHVAGGRDSGGEAFVEWNEPIAQPALGPRRLTRSPRVKSHAKNVISKVIRVPSSRL